MKEKILNNILVSSSGCWEWQRSCISNGYGRVYHDGTKSLAHRYSYMAFKGVIPDGLFVLHKCDNRKCCNPDHLFLGTNTDNMRDMVSKNRHKIPNNKGTKHGMSKLTEEDVKLIYLDTRSNKTIASDFNVSSSTVSSIKRGERWQHVTSMLESTM